MSRNQPSNGGQERLMLGGGVGRDRGGPTSNRLQHQGWNPTSDLCDSQDPECNRSAPTIHKENARVKMMKNDTGGSSNNTTEEDAAEHARLLNPASSPESAPSIRRNRSENSTEEPDHGQLESPHPTQAREGSKHDESCPLLDARSQSGSSSSNRGESPNNNETLTATNVPPNNDVDEDDGQTTYRRDKRQAKLGIVAADKTVSTNEETYTEGSSSNQTSANTSEKDVPSTSSTVKKEKKPQSKIFFELSKTSANASEKDAPSTSSTIKKEKTPQSKIFSELNVEDRLLIMGDIWGSLLKHLDQSKIRQLLRRYDIAEGEIESLDTKKGDWHDFCACAYKMLKSKQDFTPGNLTAKFISIKDQICVDVIKEYCKRKVIVDEEQTSS